MVFRRNPKAGVVFFVWALLGQILPAAEAPLSPEVKQRLEVLKSGFEAFVLKNVSLPYEEGLRNLNTKARPALERESAAAAQRKDLAGLVRIKSDIERMDKGEALTTPDVESPPRVLAAVYATYKAEYLKLQAVRQSGFADARLRYDKGLSAVQDDLTGQQDVAAALHVKQLREELAKTEVSAVMAAAVAPPAASVPAAASEAAMPLAAEWTYHLKENVGRSGTYLFKPDGTFLVTFTNMASQQNGTWKTTAKAGVISIAFSNVPVVGTDPIELKITGSKAEMDMPNVGIRYLRAKAPADSAGIAGRWTYHLAREGEARGLVTLHPDGRLVVKMKLDKQPQLGWWTDTDKPRVILIAYENNAKTGPAPWELHLSGAEAEMDLPNVGKRYLKFQEGLPPVPPAAAADKAAKVDGVVAEWTYHTQADAPSSGWVCLLPQGVMEWRDRKGVQSGKWKRTESGFSIDCMKETWTVKISTNWAEVNRPSADRHYMRVLASADEE